MDDPNSQELFQLYCSGNSEAATELFDRYVQRLISLAGAKIGRKLQHRIDAEDVVQSAYRSFFLHAANDEYALIHAGDLWRLLASITLNKLYGQIEKQTAERRNIEREESIDSTPAITLKSPEPKPAEVIAILEQLELVSRRLESDERAALIGHLQGQTNDEICKLLGRSLRTVRRLLTQTKHKIEQELVGDEQLATSSRRLLVGAAAEPRAPLLYTDYILEQLLGSGGMGKVYRATRKSTGKTMAIKTLHKIRLSDERATEQFLQEAQILGNLRHPSIVGVEGLGRFPGGGYFLVMDFINGGDLQSRLRSKRLGFLEAVRVIQAVAEAIAYAHDHGIVHCDLKPGNILMMDENLPVVSDFGFAQILGTANQYKRGFVGGTMGYIAPEVREGGQTSTAADIYALGALLWTLVTGFIPADATSIAGEHCANKSLANVCSKCLAKNPSGRYQSASDVAKELHQIAVEHLDTTIK